MNDFVPAVMSALKGLQNKIRQLEIERSTAETNLKFLADKTTHFKDILDTTPKDTAGMATSGKYEIS